MTVSKEKVAYVGLVAAYIQAQARAQNGGKRPPGMELMGWVTDAAIKASSILGIPWRKAEEGDTALNVIHTPIDNIMATVKSPIEVIADMRCLRLIVVDKDKRGYAVQSTAISYHWDNFIKAISSYVTAENQ